MVSVDTETNIASSIANRFLVGIAIATEGLEFYIPVGHNGSLLSDNYTGELPKDLLKFPSDVKLVMHNAKFDLQILRKSGFELNTDNLYDTMLMHHYTDEYPPHGLKELAGTHLGWEEPKEWKKTVQRLSKTGGGYETIPVPAMATYAMQDAYMTRELFKVLSPVFDEVPEFDKLWTTTDRPFLLLLEQMETKGLRLNDQLAEQQSAALGKELKEIVERLGFDPAKPKILAGKLFSPPPYGLGLKPSYSGVGNPIMDEAFLSQWGGHSLCADVLLFRECVKLRTAYYDAYLLLSQYDGRLHPNFKQHGTLTGRLSCEDPNLQQVPREGDVKSLFLPEPDCELWEFDFNTLEYRLAAVYANDSDLLETLRQGGDVHQTVASRLNISRHAAKTLNFAILFGGGVPTVSKQLQCTKRYAEQILQDMYMAFPLLFEKMDEAERMAGLQQWVRYWTGRRRHFKWPSEYRKAFNSVIQGGAFEISKQAMLNLGKAGYDLRNQVHDSVWINIPKEDVKNALEEVPRLMGDWTVEAFGLPFTVSPKRLN